MTENEIGRLQTKIRNFQDSNRKLRDWVYELDKRVSSLELKGMPPPETLLGAYAREEGSIVVYESGAVGPEASISLNAQ